MAETDNIDTHVNKQHTKSMPKRTLGLIVVLLIVTVALVAISVYNVKPDIPKPQPPVEKTIVRISPNANTTVSMKNTPSVVTGKTSYQLPINVESTNKIGGFQLEIKYDPSTLTNIEIVPGDYIPNASILVNSVDVEKGRITYMIGVPMGAKEIPTGAGTLAYFRFSPTKSEGVTRVEFMPKTQAAAFEATKGSVLKSATGADIDLTGLKAVTPTPEKNPFSAR